MKKSLRTVYCFACLILLQTTIVSAQTNINFITEVNRLYNINDLPKFIEGSVVKQFSSYDTTGGNNDGFEGKYSFIRKEANDRLVVFETVGKGVIERLWTPTPTNDTLDFYLDGSATPTFSIKFNDLYSGKIYPFVPPLVARYKVGGYYSYLPIPYNNGCKIVFRGERLMFFQFQYREYDNRYSVSSFNPKKMTADEEKAVADLVSLWSYENRRPVNFFGNDLKTISDVTRIAPGGSVTLANLTTGGRILGLEIGPAEIFEGMHKQLDLKITWDNEATPAVYVPAADFFGYAFGARSMRALLAGVNHANQAFAYFPMPFDERAKVELIYRPITGAKPLEISTRIYYTGKKREPDEGKFYAYWHRENPALGKPFVFLEGLGKGHYVGTIMQSQATDYITFTEFFEGDDSTVIDGVMTAHGTGSEDYFNGGWYAQPGGWVERLGGPLSGCLDYSLPQSRTGGYRFFISDKMPFSKNIHHSMEHGPEKNNRPVDNLSVALYYAEKPVAVSMLPANQLPTVPTPRMYSFYSRLMDHLSYQGSMKQEHGNALLNGKEGTMLVNVEELPAGQYTIKLFTTTDVPSKLEAGIKQPDGKIKWTVLPNGKARSNIMIGNVTVQKNKAPVEIYFRSGTQARFGFERVMFE